MDIVEQVRLNCTTKKTCSLDAGNTLPYPIDSEAFTPTRWTAETVRCHGSYVEYDVMCGIINVMDLMHVMYVISR